MAKNDINGWASSGVRLGRNIKQPSPGQSLLPQGSTGARRITPCKAEVVTGIVWMQDPADYYGSGPAPSADVNRLKLPTELTNAYNTLFRGAWQ